MIEVVSTLDGLAALRPEWNALAATAATPLLSHNWVYACAEAFGPNERLAVFLVRDRGRLHALAPLMVEHSGRGARLVSLSHRTGEPDYFLYRDEQALVGLSKMVVKSGLPLSLTRLDSAAPELRSFEAIPRMSECRLHCETRLHANRSRAAWAGLGQIRSRPAERQARLAPAEAPEA